MISIIVPVYNVESCLDRCVRSICEQTYTDIEILLVDDGSTDNSGNICDEWAVKDSRIVVIHKTNGGISSARNAAIDIAKGEYIGFVDSDDAIEPEMYERLLANMSETNCDVSCCAYKALYEDGTPCKQLYENIPTGIMSINSYVKTINANMRTRAYMIVVWNKLYRRGVIGDVRFKEGTIHEDEYFFNDTVLSTDRVSFIDETLYYYYQHDKSVMHVRFDKGRLAYFYALRERVHKCRERQFETCITDIVIRECVNSGIRFWLLSEYDKLLDNDESISFYKDIVEMLEEYRGKLPVKEKVMWGLFNSNPGILRNFYCKYKHLVN